MRKFKATNVLLAMSLVFSGVGVVGLTAKNNSKVEPIETKASVADYYSGIDASDTGTTLLNKLHALNESKIVRRVGYDGMREKFALTDTEPGAGGKIVGFYDNTLVGPSWDSGSTWNREHVWPNSHGGGSKGGASSPYADSDMHMVRPASTTTNSTRGNDAYAASGAYDPGSSVAEYRGIAARIIFYTAMAYNDLSIVDSTNIGNTTMGKLSDLLKWNIQYAPDNSSTASRAYKTEQNRNEVIYSDSTLQGNRNPFIDHPEYACRIWGSTNSTTQSICSNDTTADNNLTKLTMNQTSVMLAAGGSVQLSVTPTPSNASSSVTWSSSNQSVATVANGLVTINASASVGQYAAITATSTVDTSIKAVCNITIVDQENVDTGDTGDTGSTSESQSFDVTFKANGSDSGTNITNSNYSDEITDGKEYISSVSDVSKVYPGASGLKFGSSSATGSITFNASTSLSSLTVKNLKVHTAKYGSDTGSFNVSVNGGTNVTVTPSSGTTDISLNNVSISTIKVSTTAKRAYLAGFTFETAGGSTPTPTDTISLNKSSLSLEVGSSETLIATASGTVTWETSNSSIATVSNGTVTAVAAGSATITATCGTAKATCSVSVTAPVSTGDPSTDSLTTKGTAESPFTVADARAFIDLNNGETTENEYYVTGIISSVDTAYDSRYGNISLNLVDVSGDSTTFLAYRITCTAEEGALLVAGVKVVIKGNLVLYNGSVYENTKPGALVSYEIPTTPETPDPEQPDDPVEDVGGKYDITFDGNGNSSDGSAVLNATGIMNITSTSGGEIDYLDSFSNISQVYQARGTNGLKFASGKSAGSLTINFTSTFATTFTVSKITLHTAAYSSSENGPFTLKVNGTTYTGTNSGDDVVFEFSPLVSVSNIALSVAAGNRIFLKGISLEYPLDDEYTAENFATDFLAAVSCDPTGATTPTLSKTWSELATLFNSISTDAEKNKLVNATYTVSGSGSSTVVTATGTTTANVAKAMYRYDYIISKYGTSTYNAFIVARTPLVTDINMFNKMNNDNNLLPIVVVSFVIAATCLAGFVTLKRKER